MEEQTPSLGYELQRQLLPVLKGIGSNLMIWLILAVLFLLALVYLQRKRGLSRWVKALGSLLLVSLLTLLTLLWHIFAFFGESFTTGVDDYRLPVMLTMNALTGVVFLGLSFRKSRSAIPK